MSNEKLTKLSVKKLNELYLGKKVVDGEYFGKIIYIGYLGNLKPIPWAEVEPCLDPKETKIVPLSSLVLVANVA